MGIGSQSCSRAGLVKTCHAASAWGLSSLPVEDILVMVRRRSKTILLTTAEPAVQVYSIPAEPAGQVYSIPAEPAVQVYSIPAEPAVKVYSIPAKCEPVLHFLHYNYEDSPRQRRRHEVCLRKMKSYNINYNSHTQEERKI